MFTMRLYIVLTVAYKLFEHAYYPIKDSAGKGGVHRFSNKDLHKSQFMKLKPW